MGTEARGVGQGGGSKGRLTPKRLQSQHPAATEQDRRVALTAAPSAPASMSHCCGGQCSVLTGPLGGLTDTPVTANTASVPRCCHT